MRFQDQIVVVTGASRGIGKAIAHAFALEGAKVACISTTLLGSEKTVLELSGTGHRAYACDISQSVSVDAISAEILEHMGTPSVLVNNAGITRDSLILRMKDSDWDDVMNVNLKGTFLMIRAYSKIMMKARYGRIVNLASIIGQTGQAGQSNYAASKAGIEGLTKSVAKEFGSRNITCNAIAPGFIETDMTAELSEEMKATVTKQAPIGRLGTGQDIAAVVLFFASKEAEYITGQTLTVDGGLTL